MTDKEQILDSAQSPPPPVWFISRLATDDDSVFLKTECRNTSPGPTHYSTPTEDLGDQTKPHMLIHLALIKMSLTQRRL